MAIEKIKLDKMTDFIDKINNNFNQLPPLIIKGSSPTFKTEAQIIGQKFFNNFTGALYICAEIEYDNNEAIKNDNTIYKWNEISGKNRFPVIVKDISPTNLTFAEGVGQQYIDSANNKLYICSNINNEGTLYTWTLIAIGNIFPIIVSKDGIIKNNIAKGIGQLLIDFKTENLYMCIKKEEKDDIWCPINTGEQQIIYSSMPFLSMKEDNLWFKKNGGIEKNTSGLTTQVPIL